MKRFSYLFKLYRLQSGFATLFEISDELARKGYNYDCSLYSHWQQGTRTPTNRKLILTIIAIFAERGVIKTLSSANEFLASTGLGYLTKKKWKISLRDQINYSSPEQVCNLLRNGL